MSSNDLHKQFFDVCAQGNLVAVRDLLPDLGATRASHIQYNGQSAVDTAAQHGHNDVVEYLLNHDYFYKPIVDQPWCVANRFLADDAHEYLDYLPTFENVREHSSAAQAQAAQMMYRMQRMPCCLRSLAWSTIERQCRRNFTEIIDEIRRSNPPQRCLKMNEFFDQYRTDKNIHSLIKLYTLPEPRIYTVLQDNCGSYAALLYLYLDRLGDRAFRGYSYRGLRESPPNLAHYRSAMRHGHVVALRNFTSTSKLRYLAEIYSEGPTRNAQQAIIKFDFSDAPCPTALDLTQPTVISHVEDEEEVLVLPHTLFRVLDVEETGGGIDPCRLIITLKNVPVPAGRSLRSFICYRSRLE